MVSSCKNSKVFWLLLLVCIITLFPFLGMYEYNTKGEPREAIVSQSMLATDNWVLPRNNGGEMAYKPPFFHWSVAATSLIGNEVTEPTSRIPSAIALTVLVMTTFVFFSRRKGAVVGATSALICLLCMELHRAGGNCRVDMVLTAFTVGAFFLFYRWYEQGCHRLPLWTVIVMSLATLTKGPVGVIVPCCVIGGFLLLKKKPFLIVFGKLFACGILSLIIPALWYYAAWQQGGQEFVDLMMEENIGRMTSTMAYESCVEPWWYNFLTLTYGLIPFTLILLFGLFSLKGVSFKSSCNDNWWRRFCKWLFALDDVTLFSFAGAVIVIVFYCIPQSKRSVYLMPMYPFLAYFIAMFMLWLAKKKKKSLTIYTDLLAVLGLLLFIVFIVIKAGLVPDTIFHGKHAPENILMLHNLASLGTWYEWICILTPTIVCAYWWHYRRHTTDNVRYVFYSMFIVLAVYLAVSGAYKPAALNAKSSKYVIAELQKVCLESEGNMYEYIEVGEKALGDPVHYFELNFYLGNKIENFRKSRPSHGFLLIGEDDMALRRSEFESQGYHFDSPSYISPRRVAGQVLHVYRFHR